MVGDDVVMDFRVCVLVGEVMIASDAVVINAFFRGRGSVL